MTQTAAFVSHSTLAGVIRHATKVMLFIYFISFFGKTSENHLIIQNIQGFISSSWAWDPQGSKGLRKPSYCTDALHSLKLPKPARNWDQLAGREQRPQHQARNHVTNFIPRK